MRLLEEAILRDSYDVIVVGAGLGRMAAASLIAKRGLSVLMIDRQDKPGGSCTSFRREDVVFDVGTAMIYGFGDRGFKPFHFLMNELEEPIDMVAHFYPVTLLVMEAVALRSLWLGITGGLTWKGRSLPRPRLRLV